MFDPIIYCREIPEFCSVCGRPLQCTREIVAQDIVEGAGEVTGAYYSCREGHLHRWSKKFYEYPHYPAYKEIIRDEE
jgi:hypothetical protein